MKLSLSIAAVLTLAAFTSPPFGFYPSGRAYQRAQQVQSGCVERSWAAYDTNTVPAIKPPSFLFTSYDRDNLVHLKDWTETAATSFVNQTIAGTDGTFNVWFAATNWEFPYWSITGLLVACNLPTNYFDATPFAGLSTATNGWQGMTNVLAKLLWTSREWNFSSTNSAAVSGAYSCSNDTTELCRSAGEVDVTIYGSDLSTYIGEDELVAKYLFLRRESLSTAGEVCFPRSTKNTVDFYQRPRLIRTIDVDEVTLFQFTLDHSNVDDAWYDDDTPTNTLVLVRSVINNSATCVGPYYFFAWQDQTNHPPVSDVDYFYFEHGDTLPSRWTCDEDVDLNAVLGITNGFGLSADGDISFTFVPSFGRALIKWDVPGGFDYR